MMTSYLLASDDGYLCPGASHDGRGGTDNVKKDTPPHRNITPGQVFPNIAERKTPEPSVQAAYMCPAIPLDVACGVDGARNVIPVYHNSDLRHVGVTGSRDVMESPMTSQKNQN